MSNSKRTRCVADLILRELAALLRSEVSDPRLKNISITGVDLSPDLGQARVYYSVLEKEQLDQASHALSHACGHFRHELSLRTALQRIPRLVFVYDKSVIHGEEISQLINEKFKHKDD